MNCFSQRFRQTAPMLGSSKNELVPSKPPRRNGWSWPPQAFQVVGWSVYSYLTIVSFGIYIPLLPLPWKHVVYTVSLTHSGSFLFEYGANISLCWVFLSFFVCAAEQDKDFVVWRVCMGCMWHTFFFWPKRHNQWPFCKLLNATWCQPQEQSMSSVFISHAQDLYSSCSLILVPLNIFHITAHLSHAAIFFKDVYKKTTKKTKLPWLFCAADGRSVYCALIRTHRSSHCRSSRWQREGQAELFHADASLWPNKATACYPRPTLLSLWCECVCILSSSL